MYYYVTSNGGKRKRTRPSDGYAEALAKYADIVGLFGSAEAVAEAIDRYLVEAVPRKAQRTQDEYRRQAQKLREVFAEFRLDQVRPVDIYRYLDSHPHKVAANREVALLSSVYSHAMRWGWCDQNPCTGVRKHSEKARERYIEDRGLTRLREVASPQFQCIIDLAYLSGMRKGDIIKVKLSDIREDGLHVRQEKTGKRQVFEMTPPLTALLGRIRRLRRRLGSLSLFCTRRGQPYTVSGFNSIWRRRVRRSGLEDVHFHDIRAKSLTDAKRYGGLDYAQALGGHEKRGATEGHVKAREIDRVRPLDRVL